MKYSLKILLVLLLFASASCSEPMDTSDPEGALHTLRNALMEDDMEAVVAMTSQRTRDDLEKMHALLQEQTRAFESDDYSLVEKMKARAAYPKAVRQAETPTDLFQALVAPRLEKMERDDSLKFGLTSQGTVTQVDRETSVSTYSGQSVGFVEENGEWKTTVFETSINRNLLRVEANASILKANLDTIAKARSKDKDTKTDAPNRGPK